MTNEQTIDEIMEAVITSQVATAAYDGSSGPGTDELERAMFSADGEVRDLITAALAAKDAEIERLKAKLAEPAPGEWIEWAGGECPLNDSVRHSIRKRDGWQSAPDISAADWYGWRHNGSSADIVAYRVLA